MADNLPAPEAGVNQRALAPLGRALAAYQAGRRDAVVRVWVEGELDRELAVAHFFRQGRHLTAMDRAVLGEARGSVLDVGAGAGAVAVPLAARGHAVTALEILAPAVRVLRARGLSDVRQGSVWALDAGQGWDTVLALMNGTALAGTRGRLGALLARLAELTAPGGRILVDSTALCGPDDRLPDGRFAGELHFQLEFEGRKGDPFPQLFVPSAVLLAEAKALGLGGSVVRATRAGSYLVRLVRMDD